ncbi:MAG: 50S ribosomal protein L39e [Nitrososphaeria archaeon]|jgi:large subunit ribosomal protein L39e
MSSRKTAGEKIRYMSYLKSNRPPPTWVIVKTKRKVMRSPAQRNWRANKLDM